MEEWKEYKLGEIADIQTGPFGSQLHQRDYVPVGTPCIMPTNIGNRLNIETTNIAHVKDEDIVRLQRHCVKEGDIIYSRRGDIEKCAYILSANEGWLCGTGCLRLRINNKDVNSRFVAYQLSTNECKKWIVGNAVGSTMLNLNTSILKELPLHLPSKDEQDRYVKILKSLDDKIELNRRINDNLYNTFFVVVLMWLLTSRRNDNLEQQGQALFEEYVMNPNKPRTQLLSDYAFINPTRAIEKGKTARCIDMSSLPTKGTFPNDWMFKQYNGGMKFQNGDTIMARITPCLENGKTAYINFLDDDEVAFGSTEYIVLSAQEGICSEMLYFLARHDDFVSYAVAHMNGSSGRQRVSGNDIANYVMPEITNETMDIVSEKLHEFMEVIKNNSIESRRLVEIRDTLLPRLMSGELKVSEIIM